MKTIRIKILLLLILPFTFSGCELFIDDSEAPVSIVNPPPEANNIIVTEPVFGTILNPGDEIIIKWNAHTISKIDIQLYRKSEYKFTIIENLSSNNVYKWNIPVGIPLSNHYHIKIQSHSNNDIFDFSEQFGIQ